jgi:phage-related protein
MAWGIWNKIKNGIKKAAGAVGSAVSWVGKKVLPVLKPIANAAAPALNGLMPGLGTGISTGVNIGSKLFGGDDDGYPSAPPPARYGSGGSGQRAIVYGADDLSD